VSGDAKNGPSVPQSKKRWEELAKLDPCWAILSDPSKQFGGWDLDEFFHTGDQEVSRLIESAKRIGYSGGRDTVLDFGCGMGRLTRALSKHFNRCVGVDISEEMIRKARELNGDIANCQFKLNASAELEQFEDDQFDLIYTSIVLQHVPTKAAILRYVAELVRTLKPKGLLVMQIPSAIPFRRLIQPRRRLYVFLRSFGIAESFLYRRFGLHPMQMNYVPQEKVLSFLKEIRARIVQIESDGMAGSGIASRTYYVTKGM
jgi:ubiquinone/menaquinone biosynthesis C-methylase UbiE